MNTDDDPNNSPTLKMIRVLVVAVIVGLAGLALLIALSGCSSSTGGDHQAAASTAAPVSSSAAPVVSSSAPAGAAQGVFGQTMFTSVGPTDAGTVKVVVNTPTVAPRDPTVWQDMQGDKCVTFQVAVINNGPGPVPIPGKWALRGVDGRAYEKVPGCGRDNAGELPDDPMQPQAVASGTVTFIGPEHGVLMYKPPMSLIDMIDWTY